MKKLILITIIALTAVSVKANEVQKMKSEISIQSNDDLIKKIANVRMELASLGYSVEMMNDLFGDENFYFPTNEETLDLVIYLVDKLIENGQYDAVEKPILTSLAKDAYMLMGNTLSAE